MSPLNVIIDTDPGVDDFLAIALALNSPELHIEAVTTTGGNAALRHTNANALRILEALERTDIRVYRGAQRPLTGRFGNAEDVHGSGGLPIRLPRPFTRAAAEHAVRFMADRLRAGPAATLILLGPATNLARLLRDYPDVRANIERVVVMGGALDVPGNVTPYAEFNVWSDPEAAAIVIASGLPVILVGSDVCNRVRARAEDTATPAHPVIARLLEAQFAARPGRYITLYDPLTVLATARPELLTLTGIPIAVDTTSGPERGRTRRDASGPVIDVATGVDPDAAIRLFNMRVVRGRFGQQSGPG